MQALQQVEQSQKDKASYSVPLVDATVGTLRTEDLNAMAMGQHFVAGDSEVTRTTGVIGSGGEGRSVAGDSGVTRESGDEVCTCLCLFVFVCFVRVLRSLLGSLARSLVRPYIRTTVRIAVCRMHRPVVSGWFEFQVFSTYL